VRGAGGEVSGGRRAPSRRLSPTPTPSSAPPPKVVDCIDLGRATLSKIRQNLGWALFYNVFGIPLAAGALLPSLGIALNPSAAGGMMAMSSVAVVSNSLLLRAHKARSQLGRGGGAGGGAAEQQQRQQRGGGGGLPADAKAGELPV
jgi:Cu+-exporting ATPase